jgi:hypothetical protein
LGVIAAEPFADSVFMTAMFWPGSKHVFVSWLLHAVLVYHLAGKVSFIFVSSAARVMLRAAVLQALMPSSCDLLAVECALHRTGAIHGLLTLLALQRLHRSW